VTDYVVLRSDADLMKEVERRDNEDDLYEMNMGAP
jgi:hypothetical protein